MVLLGCGGPKSGAPEAKSRTSDEQLTDEARPGAPAEPTPMATPTPGPAAGGPSTLPSPNADPLPGSTARPTPAGGAGLAPSAAGSVVVIAKITDAGPIGDGKCSQRSYELAVAKTLAGSVPPKLWAHFEQCGARTSEPAAGNLAGTGLANGTTYQLTLKQGASKNFGDGFMIIDARAP